MRVIIIFILLSIALPVVSASPVLLYSDLTSAPNTGWSDLEPDKGAAITVWGYGFGENRGSSYIRVNGVKINASDYYVWGENWPTKYWQKITFRLNENIPVGSEGIEVIVDGEVSNLLNFTVRDDGRIFFVTKDNPGGDGSLNNPYGMAQIGSYSLKWNNNNNLRIQPGDIYYFRNESIYDEVYISGNTVMWLREGEPSGNSTHPISFIGYPGEMPVFLHEVYSVNFRGGMQISSDYNIVSNFRFDSEYSGVSLGGNYNRLIGNDLTGLKDFYGAGTGIVVTGGSGSKIYGNAIHGGRSANRFDHATYFSGCGTEQGSYLGWNHIYDNDFGRGPELAVNHQQERCETVIEIQKSHYIFNNIVDCSPQRAVGVNVFDLSYDEGEEEPGPTYIYNNLFLSCGTLDTQNKDHIGWAPALIANSGHSRFYNNLVYNTQYTAYSVGDNVLSNDFKNNIVVLNSTAPLDGRDHRYVRDSSNGIAQIENNLFFDIGSGSISIQDIDPELNFIGVDPLFVNPTLDDFTLQETSSAINMGETLSLNSSHNPPINAPINRDLTYMLRENGFDLGPYEFGSQTQSCLENWSCSSWSVCQDSSQQRTCLDQNVCGTNSQKPPEQRSCSVETNPQTDFIIFEDNFDSQPDWTSTMYNYGSLQNTQGGDILPLNWTMIYQGTRWSPEKGFPNNRASLEILEEHSDKARGQTGKSAVMFRESFSLGWKNWASDSQLLKYFNTQYDELYFDFYISFGPDFYGLDNEASWTSKIFRAGSWSGKGGGGTAVSGYQGELGPIYIWDYKHDSYGVRNAMAFRGGPWGENYYFNNEYSFGGSFNFKDHTLGHGIDGSDPLLPDKVYGGYVKDYQGLIDHEQVYGQPKTWTKVTFRLKMNSAPGVEDGVFTQWIDGVQIRNLENVPWIMENQNNSMVGWNYFAIGGNDYFQPYDNALRFEDWYSIDDVVVYHPLNSTSSMWENSPKDGRLPEDYQVGSTIRLDTQISLPYHPPQNPNITYLDDSQVTLSWDVPQDYQYSRLEVYRNGTEMPQSSFYNYHLETNATSFTDKSITQGSFYAYRILGRGYSGEEFFSKPLYVDYRNSTPKVYELSRSDMFNFTNQNTSQIPNINDTTSTTPDANQSNSSQENDGLDDTSVSSSGDTSSSSGSSGSSGSSSSGGGSSSGSSNLDLANQGSQESGSSDSEISSYVAPSCQSDFSYSAWSSCVDGTQFRIVEDLNSCVESTQETRVCQEGADENELKELNAKEIQFAKINNRRYETILSESYNEMVYTKKKLEDESFVVIDKATNQQYLGTLVDENQGNYYYTLERVDQNNLNTLKEEGLAQRSLTESVTSTFQDFKNSRNFVSVLVILSLFGITTIIYFISRYMKRVHSKSNFK